MFEGHFESIPKNLNHLQVRPSITPGRGLTAVILTDLHLGQAVPPQSRVDRVNLLHETNEDGLTEPL